MTISELAIDDKIHYKLSEDGLRDLCTSMWAVDCQTCGRFLGDEAPALCVDDSIVFAYATLHHPSCHPPEWNDSGVAIRPSGDHLSYITTMLMLPLLRGQQEQMWPMLLINPGLEGVTLAPDEHQQWRVRPNAGFSAAGLVPVGQVKIGKPVTGATAFVSETSIAVTFDDAPFGVYEAPADEPFRESARARGGILAGVTHALHPGELTQESFDNALVAGKILMGWVGLHGTKPVSAPNGSALNATCVLHWNDHRMSVGTLVDRAPRILTSKKARSWAQRMITAGGDRVIPWRLVDDDNPDDGWYTMTVMSARQYFLRRYTDGWKLVQAFSRVDGDSVESDNEAKAWAAAVLRHKTGSLACHGSQDRPSPDVTRCMPRRERGIIPHTRLPEDSAELAAHRSVNTDVGGDPVGDHMTRTRQLL